MELKNAVAVCLIAIVSATLVVLIARALDMQAASRLEPQLARIIEELEAIRKSGGVTAGAGGAAEIEAIDDAVVVYYFHGNKRCPNCQAIESQAYQAVRSNFAPQMESGQLIWKVLNYEEPSGTELGKKFEIQMPVVVVVRMNDGQIEDWRRLDEVWALVDDKPAYSEHICSEVGQMLEAASKQSPLASSEDPSETPPPLPELPDTNDLPVPAADTELDAPVTP